MSVCPVRLGPPRAPKRKNEAKPPRPVATGLGPGFWQLLEQLVSGPMTLEGAGGEERLPEGLPDSGQLGRTAVWAALTEKSHTGSPSTRDPPLCSEQRGWVGTGAHLRHSCPGQLADIMEPLGTGTCSRNRYRKGRCHTREPCGRAVEGEGSEPDQLGLTPAWVTLDKSICMHDKNVT